MTLAFPLTLALLAALTAAPAALALDPPREPGAADAASTPQEEKDADAKDAQKKDDAAKDGEKKAEEDPEKKARDRARKIAKLERELEIAHVEEKIASLAVRLDQRQAAAAVEKARHGLERAKAELQLFLDAKRPTAIEKARMSLDRARYSAEHALAELNELKAMYEADEFAELTKELVIQRQERSLELARRNLAVEEAELAVLVDHELAWKQEDLERKVEEAGRELEEAELKRQQSELQSDVKQMKARHSVEDLEHQLDDLRAEQT